MQTNLAERIALVTGAGRNIGKAIADAARAAGALKNLPNARFYADWRQLLDKEENNIDAVMVRGGCEVIARQPVVSSRPDKAAAPHRPIHDGAAKARTKDFSRTRIAAGDTRRHYARRHTRIVPGLSYQRRSATNLRTIKAMRSARSDF